MSNPAGPDHPPGADPVAGGLPAPAAGGDRVAGSPPGPGSRTAPTPGWVVPVVLGLCVALIAATTTAIVQTRAVQERDERLAAVQTRIDDLEAQVDQLEDDLATARADGGPAGLLDDLISGDGSLEGLLDGLLGSGSGGLLDGLFDDGERAEGALGGLLDGLLGDTPPGIACLVPDGEGGLGGLGGLGEPGGLGGLLDGLLGRDQGATDLDALVAEVADQVATLRELRWESDVEVTVLDDVAIRARLAELTEPDAEQRAVVAARQALLVGLGAIPPETDLIALQQQLLADSVAGFYVPETGETVVRADPDQPLGPADRITLAHELDHALTDQVLGLPDRQAPPLADDRDADLAALALVEGDATLIMQQWAMAHLSFADQLSIAFDPAVAASASLVEGLPHVVVAELLFPYTAGLDYVCDQVLDGGWAAIDAAYASPPTTTAEILTGTARTPIDVEVPGDPGDDARPLGRATFGAADLRFHLEAPGGAPSRAVSDITGAVAAWGGGSSRSWTTPEGPAAGVALVDRSGSGIICAAMTAWATATWPDGSVRPHQAGITVIDDRALAVRCDDEVVTIGAAPDPDRAAAIAGD